MQPPVTLRDVARAANVSISTASRALAGSALISASTQEKLQRHASDLGYRPNILARGLKTRSSGLVGLVVHNLANASFRVLAETVQRRLRIEGLQMVLCITNDDPAQEHDTLAALAGQCVEGLIICPTGANGAQLAALDRSGIPVTCVVRRDEAAPLETILAADPDGAYEGTRYLLGLGHTKIGLIVGRNDTTSGRERLSGYRRALEEASVGYDPGLVHAGRYVPETGAAGCAALFDRADRPSALFVANHESALGVLSGLAERGISFPGDVSLLCYEDMPGFAWQQPGISVVDSGAPALAELAADRLLLRLRGQPTVPSVTEYRIGARLLLRQSCRAVN